MNTVSEELFMCQTLHLHDLSLHHGLEVRLYGHAHFRDEGTEPHVRDVLLDTDIL